MTVILHSRRLVFLKTRKTAGTSVELALSAFAEPDDVLAPLDPPDERRRAELGQGAQQIYVPFSRYRTRDVARLVGRGRRATFTNHMRAVDVRAALGRSAWDDYLKVTVERDPYERAVSLFRWTCPNADHSELLPFLRRVPISKLSNFDIYGIDGQVVADLVLDHASLDVDFRQLVSYLGTAPSLGLPVSKSRGRVRSGEAMELLGVEGRRIVEAACARELAIDFGNRRFEVWANRRSA